VILTFWFLFMSLGSVELCEGSLVDCFFIWTVVAEAFSGARVEVVVMSGGGGSDGRRRVWGGVEDTGGEVGFWRAPS
jgi:hypothetical protein